MNVNIWTKSYTSSCDERDGVWESQRLSADSLFLLGSLLYKILICSLPTAIIKRSRFVFTVELVSGRSVWIWVTGGSIRGKMGRAINRLIMIDWLIDWIASLYRSTHIVYINIYGTVLNWRYRQWECILTRYRIDVAGVAFHQGLISKRDDD